MERYTLHDLEKLTGIKAATIRIWERRYNIIRPHRTATYRRWYNDDDLRRLLNISILYRSGIKISKIALLSESILEEKAALLTEDTLSNDTRIDSLVVAMISFNETSVNEILLRSIINTGFEETYTGVVFPFLRRVGVMWHTGSVNIGAEHFICNIFRKRLIASTDALPPSIMPGRKRILMYLPENELHEMGLLFYAYLFRRKGHDIMYLGQSTPFSALTLVNDQWHADLIVTGLQSPMPNLKPEEYLRNLSTTFTNKKILVSGSLADTADKMGFPNIIALRSVDDLRLII